MVIPISKFDNEKLKNYVIKLRVNKEMQNRFSNNDMQIKNLWQINYVNLCWISRNKTPQTFQAMVFEYEDMNRERNRHLVYPI